MQMRIATSLVGEKLEAATLAEMLPEEPLSPNSVIFVRTLSTHIIFVVGLGSPIDVAVFREQVPLALNHPRFLSLMVGDWKKDEELKWVQIPQVNIDDHLIIPKLDQTVTNNRLTGDKFVEEYLNELTKTTMDTSKPPWEMHLLNVETSEAESLVVFRIPHSFGDGISITSHIVAWTRLLSDNDALPTIATIKKKVKREVDDTNVERGDDYRCWKLPKRFILAVWWWFQLLWNTFIDVLMVLATICNLLKDSDMIPMIRTESNTIKRRIVHKIVSLDDMKVIKTTMKVTINDVIIGILEAGVSRFLIRRFANDYAHKDKMGLNCMLKKLRMRMSMLVNLRPLADIQGLEDIKGKGNKLGLRNEIGCVMLPLSIRMEDDPSEYVRKAKLTVDRKKHSFEAQSIAKIRNISMKLFGYKGVGALGINFFSNVSISVSNVPGPMEEIGFFGHPIKFIAPTIYGIPSPIIIHLQSCTNKMSIVISIRDDVMVDPHELCDDMVESLRLIKDSVSKKKND